jgi:hypothetical protein
MACDPDVVARIVRIFNAHGAVVLRPTLGATEDDHAALDVLFGSRVPHEKMDARGVVTIDPSNPNSVNVADVEHPHLCHTDEAYSDAPGAIMTLQCAVPAAVGGESTLVAGAALLDAAQRLPGGLPAPSLDAMFRHGKLVVGRALPGSADVRSSALPLLWVNGQGRVEMRWRSRDSYILSVAPELEAAYDAMNRVATGTGPNAGPGSAPFVYCLRAGEMVIVDNRAVAHGRLPYAKGLRRRLLRVNYFGNGCLAQHLVFGIRPAKDLRPTN